MLEETNEEAQAQRQMDSRQSQANEAGRSATAREQGITDTNRRASRPITSTLTPRIQHVLTTPRPICENHGSKRTNKPAPPQLPEEKYPAFKRDDAGTLDTAQATRPANIPTSLPRKLRVTRFRWIPHDRLETSLNARTAVRPSPCPTAARTRETIVFVTSNTPHRHRTLMHIGHHHGL